MARNSHAARLPGDFLDPNERICRVTFFLHLNGRFSSRENGFLPNLHIDLACGTAPFGQESMPW
ncbi:hypothetical protein [Stenotrophomonas sp. S41]|uniref:hypothetical protein n=1 Tax=Stenotrophomonas sp. S41 TaxID=2767464 RepID=UPI00190BF963|nr:hypothetical protein [Stenotrophomonas sp. S41]MBK0012788.1 hypothetical protein [Stenotrophomonas sp. S41]